MGWKGPPEIWPPQASKDRDWIAPIDGLRAIAVLAVVVHHTNSALIGRWALGNMGVAVFFAISGFLAYCVLRRDEQQRGRIDYSYFLLRRILRIWPAYLVVIVAATIVEWGSVDTVSWAPLFGFSLNWHMAFFQTWPLPALAPLWSIAVEEQFYAVAPLMYLAIRSRHRVAFSVAVVVIANLLRVAHIALDKGSSGNGGLYYATYAYADVFVAGALVAHWHGNGGTLRAGQQVAIGFGSLVLIIAVMKLWGETAFPPYNWIALLPYALLPLCGMLPLIAALPLNRQAFSTIPSLPWMRFIGDISYGIYLFHLLVIYSVPEGSPLIKNVVVLGVTLALAFVSYRFIEQPARALKNSPVAAWLVSLGLPAVLTISALTVGIIYEVALTFS